MVRYPIFIASALLVTFGLFWSMQALVSVGFELDEAATTPRVEFVRLKREPREETKKREPPDREKPDRQPPPPPLSMANSNFEPGQGIAEVAPQIDASEALSGGIGTGGGSDRDVVPLVQIRPEYPMRARQRGIEGWVTVRFTVGTAGTVTQAEVAASNPPRMFDAEAIQAIRKWKFNPKIEDGKAVTRSGMMHTFMFRMEG